jgi:hypothetical protein
LISLFLLLGALGLAGYGIRQYVLAAPDSQGQQRRRNLMLVGVVIFLALVLMNRSGLLLPLLAGALALLVRLAPVLLRLFGHAPQGRYGEAETAGSAGSVAQPGKMTEAEALEILGLEPGCSRQSVQEAHRRLIQKLHPDRGGSGYLAAKINQARDILLN